VPQTANLWIGNHVIPDLTVDACSMLIAYYRKTLAIVPHDTNAHVEGINKSKKGYDIRLTGAANQTLELYFLNETPKCITFNKKKMRFSVMKLNKNAYKTALKIKLRKNVSDLVKIEF